MANAEIVFQKNLNGTTTWTYGNWGGAGWSGGKFTQPGELVDRRVKGLDPLDEVFKSHDTHYEDAMVRWNASAKTVGDTWVFWKEIVAADKQMVGDINALRTSGVLGNPPGLAPASAAYIAAAQATAAFLSVVIADHENNAAYQADPEKVFGILPSITLASSTKSDAVVIRTVVQLRDASGKPQGNVVTTETTYLASNGVAGGYSVTETTNNSTGVSTFQLKDANGNPVASGSNYSVAQNNTIAFDAGTSKQIYDLNTGRMVAQVDANGAGFQVDPTGAGNDTFYTAGQLSYSGNTGLLTTTVGSQTSQLLGTTNTLTVTTNTGTSNATQTSTPSAESLGVSIGNNLISTGSFSVGIAPVPTPTTVPSSTGWDVNSAQGNYALAGYLTTQGLRPGNSSVGLQATLPPVIITDFANVDYSLGGAALNTTSSGFNFTLPVDPLILDLDGGGVSLTSYADKPVQFDIDNDGSTQFNGSKEQTGWMASGEGMVVQDLNGNGQIDGIAETLSEFYNGSSGGQTGQVGQAGQKRFASGFAALKSLDSNNDNQFTKADVSQNTNAQVAETLNAANASPWRFVA